MLTRKQADEKVQLERLSRLGKAASILGEADKAQKAYAKAAEIDPAHLEAQRGRAEWHFRREEWSPALDALRAIVQYHANSLPVSERVELFYQVGMCEKHLGQADRVAQMFGRA